MPRYLDPKSDIVFKKIFGEHPHILKSFLNALLPLPEDALIESLEYLPTEQIPTIPILKRTVVDVKCQDTLGRFFIVEMQIEWTDAFMQRLLFGTAQAYVKQLEKGERYELLCPVYGLGIINETFDHDTDDWYHHYSMINVHEPKKQILKGLSLVFLELPKFQVKRKEDKTLRVLWLRFMREIKHYTQEISEDLLKIPEIKEAITLAEEAAYTRGELEAYDAYWDAVSTEKTLLFGRYEEGRAEGLSEGLEKGRTESLKQMISRMQQKGYSADMIMELIGLSVAEFERITNTSHTK